VEGLIVMSIDFQTLQQLSRGASEANSTCPLCSAVRKPINRNKPVLKIWNKEPGFATYKCQHCGAAGYARDDGSSLKGKSRPSEDEIAKMIAAAVASQPAPTIVEATYDYTDENGVLLYQVMRMRPKDFRYRRPAGNDGWINGRGDRIVPYRWPDLLKYPDATIFVCEGEKDADRVASLGYCATNVASGGWVQCAPVMAGRDVVILRDSDEAGAKRALEAAIALQRKAKTIRIAGMPDGAKDVSDWLDVDPVNADRLLDICFNVPPWEPPPEEPSLAPTNTITIKAGNLQEVVDKSEVALINAGAPLYARGGELVKPIVEDVAAFRGRRTKVTRLKVVNVDCLRDHLSRTVRYERFDGRTKKWVPTNPPPEVAATLLARDGEWKFSRLTGIASRLSVSTISTVISLGTSSVRPLSGLRSSRASLAAPRPVASTIQSRSTATAITSASPAT
jgi:hypothetical protein